MRTASQAFADDPCSSTKRGAMVKAARALLSSVTRLLILADMVDVHHLLESLHIVSGGGGWGEGEGGAQCHCTSPFVGDERKSTRTSVMFGNKWKFRRFFHFFALCKFIYIFTAINNDTDQTCLVRRCYKICSNFVKHAFNCVCAVIVIRPFFGQILTGVSLVRQISYF